MEGVIAAVILLFVILSGCIYSDYRLELSKRRMFFKEVRMKEIESYDGD